MVLLSKVDTDVMGEFTTQLAVLNNLAEQLRTEHRTPRLPGIPVAVLSPAEGAVAYAALIRDAKVGVRSTTRLPLIGAPLWRQTAHVIELLRSGRKWRDIYDAEAIHAEGMLRHLREVGAAGEASRTLPKVPLKLVIGDDDVALLAIEDDSARALHTVRIGRSGLLRDVIEVFETLWSLATPIPDRAFPNRSPGDPSRGDCRLLSLLAAGATDDAIARELGISLRTVQRRVRRLEDMLGARTRFQAGIQAARRALI